MCTWTNKVRRGMYCCIVNGTNISSDDILDSLHKLRIRESAQFKTVLELYDLEIHHKISMPNYQKLKTMVKRSTDQKLRLRNFDARHRKIETGAVVKHRKGLTGIEGGKGSCCQCKENGHCSKENHCSLLHESNSRAQKTRTHCRHAFRAIFLTRSKCVEEKKYPKQK